MWCKGPCESWNAGVSVALKHSSKVCMQSHDPMNWILGAKFSESVEEGLDDATFDCRRVI